MADFDRNQPSIARVYDYLLGGKDNFAADRELADRLLGLAPEIVAVVRENRSMLTRAVSWAADQGIRQFVDLGCGMPTEPSTHETARLTGPESKIVYIDNDPVVVSHLTALAGKDPAIAVIDCDLDDSGAVLAAAGKLIDLSRPACLILGSLVHFYEPDAARDLVGRYVSALAPGSYVVLTAAGIRPGPAGDEVTRIYSAGSRSVRDCPAEEVMSYLDGLEVLPPGVADARVWRPDWKTVAEPDQRDVWINGVMARVPGQ